MKKNIQCEKIKVILFDYLTQRLDQKIYKNADLHLKTCKVCQNEVNVLKKTLNLIDLAKPPLLGPEFTKEVMANFEEKRKEKPVIKEKESLWKRWLNVVSSYHLKPLPIVASIIIVFIGVFIHFNYFSPKKEVIPKKIEITLFRPIKIISDNLASTLSAARAAVHLFKGEILVEEARSSGIQFTIKLPVEKESDFIKALKNLGILNIEGNYKNKEGYVVVFFEKK